LNALVATKGGTRESKKKRKREAAMHGGHAWLAIEIRDSGKPKFSHA